MNRKHIVLLVLFIWGQTVSSDLTRKQKKTILNFHNDFRSRASPQASNMMKLEWDNNLARVAQDWADTCAFGHNGVSSTNRWDWVGENIAFSSETNIQNMIKMWELEKEIYQYSSNNCRPVPRNKLLSTCGHYTQMVWADTRYVGCGFKAGCPQGPPNRLVCNYGEGGNIRGMKPYRTGRKCSSCPNGYKGCSYGLCTRR